MPYRLLADAVLVLHVLLVVFVVFGLLLIFIGGTRGWGWVRNPRFRIAHAITMGIVVLQVWLGKICPLTTLEMVLREKAGDAVYEGGFIAHWLGKVLYYDLPLWVFALAYTLFGVIVTVSWFVVRPDFKPGKET
ncbi:MAG: hypothetical protein BMS9Abin11_0884 [Gammaproteobacteria bacterium]|nr:MAG: hypothetical protein BMS9Abin11_0884 [Gammaproteobacteria bacterium]